MKRILRRILVFLGLLLVFGILAIGPKLLGYDATDWVKGLTNDHFLPVVICVVVLALLISVFRSDGDKIFSISKSKPDAAKIKEDLFNDIRKGLAESYQSRIDSKLAYRFPINIQLKYSDEGNNTRKDLINQGVKTYGAGTIKEELIRIFDKQAGRLLIVGLPGAGKTTIMLQLALKLLERNEVQVPIVINIATWRDRFKNVEEWLEELLPQMGFSTGLVKAMLEENRILPLFDGLDELAEADRGDCLAAIAYYGKRQSVRYVICSRIEEYTATADAPVYVQVMVKPLTLNQIKQGLTDYISPETDGIIDAINKDPLLAKAIEVPFYLNTVQLLFASMKGVEEFGFVAGDVFGRQREIVEAFVKESTEGLESYVANDVIHWLGFLGDQMDRLGLTRFELVDLQYDWAPISKYQFVFLFLRSRESYLARIFLSIMVCISMYLLHVDVHDIHNVYLFSIVFIAVYLFLFIFFVLFQFNNKIIFNYKLKTTEAISINAGLLLGDSIVGFKWGVCSGLIAFLIPLMFSYPWEHQGGRLMETGSIILMVFIFVLYLCVFATISIFYGSTLRSRSYLKVRSPYQRFVKSLKFVNFVIVKHLILRIILWLNGHLPFNLVKFLNSKPSQMFIETDGGTWSFRHRILQEYFIAVRGEKYGADSGFINGPEND